MAVYTEVSDDELLDYVAQYDVGDVLSCKGIAEGIENSNFLLTTDRGPFILTLYEKRVKREDLPFFLALMEHLSDRGLPCPIPVHGRDGVALRDLCGRPAAIITFLTGMWPRRIAPHHCEAVGEALARMHLAGADFAMERPNDLSVGGWRPLFEAAAGGADSVAPGLKRELTEQLTILEQLWPKDLPRGVIHADLFPDNVFFRGEALTGVIDFYFACTDFLVYDMATCLNAWCFEPDGSFNYTKARRMTAAYGRVRKLSTDEVAALPLLARGSAMRFLLTRLYDWLFTPRDAMVTRKDPLEYLTRLRFHVAAQGPKDYGLG